MNKATEKEKIILFTCNWHAFSSLETAGKKKLVYTPALVPIRISCLGRITPGIILKAFEGGAAGVCLVGCQHSPEPVFLKWKGTEQNPAGDFYVRSGPGSIRLNPEDVEDYIKMAEGYDGRHLITQLRKYLPDNATVLELGMGPGTDLMLLSEHYKVTGSDFSNAFLDRFCKKHPNADLLQLDAITMQIDRKFDFIYSNKVLDRNA